jgi:AraC family transcriptional regulator
VSLVDGTVVRCTRTAHQRAEEERSDRPTLVLPRRGVFRHHAGRRTMLADANTVLLFHPDEPYRITHPTDHGDECVALRFERDAVADALGRASESGAAWTPDPPAHRALHRAAHAILSARETLEREERALALLAAVGGVRPIASGARGAPEARDTARIAARDAARIDAVRERLAADVGAHASLAVLARDAGVSPFHLARRFRARTGTSLHQYRLALRLATARTMILGGAGDLTRLAHDLGFASLAHFSAAFRNAYGESPSACKHRGP